MIVAVNAASDEFDMAVRIVGRAAWPKMKMSNSFVHTGEVFPTTSRPDSTPGRDRQLEALARSSHRPDLWCRCNEKTRLDDVDA